MPDQSLGHTHTPHPIPPQGQQAVVLPLSSLVGVPGSPFTNVHCNDRQNYIPKQRGHHKSYYITLSSNKLPLAISKVIPVLYSLLRRTFWPSFLQTSRKIKWANSIQHAHVPLTEEKQQPTPQDPRLPLSSAILPSFLLSLIPTVLPPSSSVIFLNSSHLLCHLQRFHLEVIFIALLWFWFPCKVRRHPPADMSGSPTITLEMALSPRVQFGVTNCLLSLAQVFWSLKLPTLLLLIVANLVSSHYFLIILCRNNF